MKPTLPKIQWMAWALGGLEVLLAMAVSVWLLTLPGVFRLYYPLLGISPHGKDACAVVDWLSTSYRERTLNLALSDRKLGEKELQHFADVRRLFREFPIFLLGLGLLTSLVAVAARPTRNLVLAAQGRGLILWLALLASVGGLAWWDWPRFFAWVHHPFFGDSSWRLPDDAYSLVLFPTTLWRMLAAVVLFSPVGLAAIVLLAVQAGSRRGLWEKRGFTSSSATAAAKRTRPPSPGERTPIAP